MTTPKLVTPKEAAKLLAVSPQTLANWRSRGYGPRWVKLGHMVRYSEAEVTNYVASHVVTKEDSREA